MPREPIGDMEMAITPISKSQQRAMRLLGLTAVESYGDWLLEIARRDGAEYPTLTESSDGAPVIVDTASGRTWKIKLEEF